MWCGFNQLSTLTSSQSFLSHAYSLSKVDEWLPAIMQNSSTKSLPLSFPSSFDAVASGFLDEDDLDDVVRFHVITFTPSGVGSTKWINHLHYNYIQE